MYWSKEAGNLSALLEQADALEPESIAHLDKKSTDRVKEAYSWEKIVGAYEKVFREDGKTFARLVKTMIKEYHSFRLLLCGEGYLGAGSIVSKNVRGCNRCRKSCKGN